MGVTRRRVENAMLCNFQNQFIWVIFFHTFIETKYFPKIMENTTK